MSHELKSHITKFFSANFADSVLSDLLSRFTEEELKGVSDMDKEQFSNWYFKPVSNSDAALRSMLRLSELVEDSTTVADHGRTPVTLEKAVVQIESIGLVKKFEQLINKKKS